MGKYCKCEGVCEDSIDRYSHDLRKYRRNKSCPTQKYYLCSIDTGASIDGDDYEDVLNTYTPFDSWEEAEEWAAKNYQCDSCKDCISKGLDPRSSCCYMLVCIHSGRWLRRMINGAWTRHRIIINRRAYDKNYKRRRKR